MPATPYSGFYYFIENKKLSKVVDCTTKGDTSVHPAGEFNTYQWWKFENAGPGMFYIKNGKSGRVLDGDSHGDVTGHHKREGNTYQMWRLVQCSSENHWNIQNVATDRNLRGTSKGKLDTKKGRTTSPYRQWELKTADVELLLTQGAINFNTPTNIPSNPDLAIHTTIDNNTGTSITHGISLTRTKLSTFAVALTQTVGISQTFSVNIDFGVGVGSDTTVSVDTSSTETRSESFELAYTGTGSITVPKNGSVAIHFVIDWVDNVEIPFTLQTNLTGVWKKDRKPLDCATLDAYLKATGFPSQNCTNQIATNTVALILEGVMTGSTGISTHIHGTKIPQMK